MSKIGVVRLESLKINNIKNIEEGEIFFPEKKKIQRGEINEDDFKNVLGIYGQNGSGKTGLLDALRLVQTMLSGVCLNPYFGEFLMIGKNTFGVTADFLIKINQKYYYSIYEVEIERFESRMRIISEKLSYKREKDNNCISFKYNLSTGINKSFLDMLDGNASNIYRYISKIESDGFINNINICSTIFNPKLYDFVVKKNKNSLGVYSDIVRSLRIFGMSRLSIYSISYFNENDNIGIRFRYKEENEVENKDDVFINCHDIFVPFNTTSLPTKQFLEFEKTIQKINKVLPSIIPNFVVEIKENKQLNRYNKESKIFLLIGKKNDIEIPLQLESNGIKKIISILSGLIEAYTNEGCLMAIDEIDSGVFEYLLGEIVYAFDNFSNGQLIFTSHNMRILEKINYKNIFFTTTDNKNVFIQLKNVKENNNLRDLYYKYLANGDQYGNKLFDSVKTEELIANLRISDRSECD